MTTTTAKKQTRRRAIVTSVVIAGLIITAGLGWATGQQKWYLPGTTTFLPNFMVSEI